MPPRPTPPEPPHRSPSVSFLGRAVGLSVLVLQSSSESITILIFLYSQVTVHEVLYSEAKSIDMSATKTVHIPSQNPSVQKLLNEYAIHSTSVSVSVSQRSPTIEKMSQSILYFNPDHISELLNAERQPADFDPTVATHPTVAYAVSNPPHWTDWFREVPDYRPVNKELNRNERKQEPLVAFVGNLMLLGCSIIANGASALRSTVGWLIPEVDKVKVGGEW